MKLRSRFVIVFTATLFLFIAFIHPALAAQQETPMDRSEVTDDITTGKVNSEAIKKLQEMTPEEIAELDRKLSKALTLYYDNRYGQALPIFQEIAGTVETMSVMWWLGTSAMKTGDTRLAIEKFTRMLAIDPNLHRVRLELALAYFTTRNYEDARRELTIVKESHPPEAVQQNISRLEEAINRETKRFSWNARFSQGIMYDTNVSAGPNNQELEVSSGTITLDNDSGKIRDEALVTTIQGAALYDIGDRQGLMWNTDVLFYNSAYQTYSKYNFMMADVTTGPWLAGPRDILKMPIGYREQYFGSERLSNIIHVDPSYEHFFGPLFSTKVSYSYNKEFFYNEDNANLENNTRIYEISPSIYLGNRRHIITGALGWEDRDADARRFCYSGWYYSLSYFTRFPTDTEVFLSYKWMEKEYKAPPLLYNQDREDRRNTITAVVSQQFFEHFFTSLAVNFADNNSNADLYEIEKTTYTLSIGFTF
ncbi:MAG: DUF560 domain-containing protein [Deltaproteobacteria bacterium]|nr:DUF560 domain-containing protein [Deltaproteobacteria bacterium]